MVFVVVFGSSSERDSVSNHVKGCSSLPGDLISKRVIVNCPLAHFKFTTLNISNCLIFQHLFSLKRVGVVLKINLLTSFCTSAGCDSPGMAIKDYPGAAPASNCLVGVC